MTARRNSPQNPFDQGKALLSSLPRREESMCADIVLVVGARATMKHVFKYAADEAEAFSKALHNSITKRFNQKLTNLRIRFIAYKDLYMDSSAMECSSFFYLPNEADRLGAFIRQVPLGHTGSPRASGMEALLCAMASDWQKSSGTLRHAIVLITDSAAYRPEDPMRAADGAYDRLLSAYLPPDAGAMPDSIRALRALWRDGAFSMDNWHSRMLVIAPQADPWASLSDFNNVSVTTMPVPKIRKLHLSDLADAICDIL